MVDAMLMKVQTLSGRFRRQRLSPCRLKAFYTTLLQINQAIVRATSVAELYRETCRITASFGCFDLARIAARAAAGDWLEVAAAHGELAAYAEGLQASLDPESPFGQGPTGICFREQRTVVCQDWLLETSSTAWRARANQYGIRCCAALPIFQQGTVVSALILYSREPQFFQPDRVELLEALCRDLSYALERFSMEAERQAAASAVRKGEIQHFQEIQQLNSSLEQRVQERTRQLEGLNEELTSFVYSISHDLRAPLRHIEGFAGMLARHLGEQLDAKAGHYLDVIQGATRRMGRLIEDILSYSKVGRCELRQADLDLNLIVPGLLEQLQVDVGERQVRWELGTLPHLNGDPVLITFLLQNLLDNALKFTRPRAEAIIEILPLEAAPGDPAGARPLGFLVRDNGVGFNQAHAGRLFNLFQRLHPAEDFEGTGVGLANALRIVTRHGGQIQGEGVVGQGATFRVTFPG